jgi:AcrR family transcriptional regulator
VSLSGIKTADNDERNWGDGRKDLQVIMKRRGGRPTKENTAAMNDQLLDGARSSFARKGIAGAALEEIAAELGVSKHTIYRRYPNKPALLEAVVKRDLDRFRQVLATAAAEKTDALDALQNVALRYFLFGTDREYSAFYLSLMAEAVVSTPLRERLAEWSGIALEPFRDAVASAQEAGGIMAGEAWSICGILVDLLEGANNRVRLAAADPADDTDRRWLFDERWSVFMAAMGRR